MPGHIGCSTHGGQEMGPTVFKFLVTIVTLFSSLLLGFGLYAGFNGATLGFPVLAAPGFFGLCAALKFAYKGSKRKSLVTIVACLWLSIVIGISGQRVRRAICNSMNRDRLATQRSLISTCVVATLDIGFSCFK